MSFQLFIQETVPSANSTSNDHLADVVGSKTDDETNVLAGNSTASLAGHAYAAAKHIHSRQYVWPAGVDGANMSTNGNIGWDVVSGAANTLGTAVQIVPAGGTGITSPFDIHFINILTTSHADTYALNLYTGTVASLGPEISRTYFVRANAGDPSFRIPVITPMSAAQTGICAKVRAVGASRTCRINVAYHLY